jgi:hypothetical protein
VKAEHFSEQKIEVDGWDVNLTLYKLGDKWHAKADNVSPGASLARVVADTKEDAEARALARAKELLSRTKRRAV